MVIATKTLPVLTSEQQAAADFEEGRALVLAVASSGKTQMLLHRIPKKHFELYLKECEFRFNFGTPSRQLKTLREWCGI